MKKRSFALMMAFVLVLALTGCSAGRLTEAQVGGVQREGPGGPAAVGGLDGKNVVPVILRPAGDDHGSAGDGQLRQRGEHTDGQRAGLRHRQLLLVRFLFQLMQKKEKGTRCRAKTANHLFVGKNVNLFSL